jgi:hypothetical protein
MQIFRNVSHCRHICWLPEVKVGFMLLRNAGHFLARTGRAFIGHCEATSYRCTSHSKYTRRIFGY